MASVTISTINPGIVSTIKTVDPNTAAIIDKSYISKITGPSSGNKVLRTAEYSANTSVKTVTVSSVLSTVTPFYVAFTNIGIPGYSKHRPAPIGIAIIGYSNYIL